MKLQSNDKERRSALDTFLLLEAKRTYEDDIRDLAG
jgi:hypothetical protein